jgi:hypothetical protein
LGKRRSKLIPSAYKTKIRIGKRELAILESLAEYRYLTAEQICRLHFPKGSQSYCNFRLRALFHHPYRYVQRHTLPVEWGKGSPKLAYSLTRRGINKLREKLAYPFVSYQTLYKQKQATPLYRKHEIAINEFRIAVELGCQQKGWQLENWITEQEFKEPSLLKQMRVVDIETNRKIPVVPDSFLAIFFPEVNKKALFFLELDRGTMDLGRFRFKKIRGYHLLAQKWQEVELFRKYRDLSITFRVLTVVDGGEKRAWNLKEKTAEREFLSEKPEEKLPKSRRFYFTTLDKISPQTIFTQPIWLIPFRSRTKEERFSLIDFTRNF